MDPLHATIEEFAAEGFTHVECFCPRCRVIRSVGSPASKWHSPHGYLNDFAVRSAAVRYTRLSRGDWRMCWVNRGGDAGNETFERRCEMADQWVFKSETYNNCCCDMNCGCQFNLPSTHAIVSRPSSVPSLKATSRIRHSQV